MENCYSSALKCRSNLKKNYTLKKVIFKWRPSFKGNELSHLTYIINLFVQVPSFSGAEFNRCRVQRVPNFVGAEFDQWVPSLTDAEFTGCRFVQHSSGRPICQMGGPYLGNQSMRKLWDQGLLLRYNKLQEIYVFNSILNKSTSSQ